MDQHNTPTAASIRGRFRRLTADRHPLLKTMSRDEIYDNGRMMAPGGMLLARMMANHLPRDGGTCVLDIGCGRGQTSVMLARDFGADVVSVDLWIEARERRLGAQQAEVSDRITALQGDMTRGLPQGTGPFDAVFVMQAFHSIGTRPGILKYLAKLVKPGGRIVIGQTSFRDDPADIPDDFREDDGWNTEYARYHGPEWWSALFSQDGLFSVDYCEEIPDGDIFWEDHILYCGDRAGWSDAFMEENAWLMRHIDRSRSAAPHLTHFILTAVKQALPGV